MVQRLQRYGTYGPVRQKALLAAMMHMKAEQGDSGSIPELEGDYEKLKTLFLSTSSGLSHQAGCSIGWLVPAGCWFY